MAKQTINIGASPNDGTGTPLRTAFDYTNQNFTELYTATGPSGNNIVVPGNATITGDLTVRTTGLVVGSTATGIGIIPNTWSGAWKAAQVGRLTLGNATTDSLIGHNFYNDGSYRFAANDFASYYDQVGGAHIWGSSVTSGTAGNAIGWTVLATLNSTGLGVGVVPSAGKGALQLSSGINFPATQVASSDANTLDDYEEGTWTIGLAFGGASTGITASFNQGKYTKIGRQVTVIGYLGLSNKGSATGNATITGLPFTVGSATSDYSAASLHFINITFADYPMGFGNPGTTTIPLQESTNAGVRTNLTDADFASNSEIIFSLTYTV